MLRRKTFLVIADMSEDGFNCHLNPPESYRFRVLPPVYAYVSNACVPQESQINDIRQLKL